MKRVGIWFNEEKDKRLEMETLYNAYKSDDLEFVKIDLNYDLESQGPFDIIVHKFLYLVVKQNFGCKKSGIQFKNFQKYYELHNDIILLDPLETFHAMLNRYEQNVLTNTVVQHPKLHQDVFAPNYCRLDSNNISECANKIQNAKLQYPIVCKPEIAHGLNIAHEMCIVFNKEGFKDISFPCIAQTFINHNARLFKIFIVGSQIYICQRPSVKNLSPGNSSTLFFNTSDVSKEKSKHELTELDEGDNINDFHEPCHQLFSDVAHIYREKSGLHLFGIDLIRCNSTSKYAIIDVNCCPGYEKMPNFHSALEYLIRDKLKLKEQCENKGLRNQIL